LICFEVDAPTIVSIVWRGVEVRISIVIMVAIVLETHLLLPQALQVLLLKTVLRHAILLLQLCYTLRRKTRLLIHMLPILRHLLLLLANELLLALL
jgi:hypothetical protein